MKHIPLNLLTLYADLVQRQDANALPAATISRRLESGKRRLYASIRDGVTRRQIYIGTEGDPKVEEKVAAYRRASAGTRDLRKTVTALKAAGIPAPEPATGRLLETLARARLFERGMVLVGTVAFQTYPCLVGAHLSHGALLTQDADLAATRFAVPHLVKSEPLETILKRADPTFEASWTVGDKWPKKFTAANGFLIELLTTRGRTEGPVTIKGLDCAAQPLRFMEYLLEEPIEVIALYGSGIRVVVPQPARYAVHKLIISQLRPGHSAKRPKDLQQAREIINALTAREPELIEEAFEDARGRGRAWAKAVDIGLAAMERSTT
jgi:hypothetical protein